jgi:hypothetical protein
MFSASAEFYDLIYSTFKDYVAEVEADNQSVAPSPPGVPNGP